MPTASDAASERKPAKSELDDLQPGVRQLDQRTEGAVGDGDDACVALMGDGDKVRRDRIVGAEGDRQHGVALADAADLVERGGADIVDQHVAHALLRQGEREIGGDGKGALAADDIDQVGGASSVDHLLETVDVEAIVDAAERGLRGGDHAVEKMQIGVGLGRRRAPGRRARDLPARSL